MIRDTQSSAAAPGACPHGFAPGDVEDVGRTVKYLTFLCCWPGLGWRKASGFEGGIKMLQDNKDGTPDIALADG